VSSSCFPTMSARRTGHHHIQNICRTPAVGEFRKPVTVQPAAGWGRCARKDKR
jgi:hypothetical protein